MNFRRYYVPNSIVFITQVVNHREPIFRDTVHLERLKAVLHNVKVRHPFTMLAYVFLPDHFHCLIKPTGVSNFSKIMLSLKSNFTKQYKEKRGIKGSMKFWQKRFSDHIIRDEIDLGRHIDYIHYNPVKHGLALRPEDWPQSSFLLWKEKSVYLERWGWTMPDALKDLGVEDDE